MPTVARPTTTHSTGVMSTTCDRSLLAMLVAGTHSNRLITTSGTERPRPRYPAASIAPGTAASTKSRTMKIVPDHENSGSSSLTTLTTRIRTRASTPQTSPATTPAARPATRRRASRRRLSVRDIGTPDGRGPSLLPGAPGRASRYLAILDREPRSGAGPEEVRAAALRAAGAAEEPLPDLRAAQVLDVVEAQLGQQCVQGLRLETLRQRLAGLGDPRHQVGPVALRLRLEPVGRGGVVEDHLTARHRRDRPQRRRHGLLGQVGHHAEPEEERGLRGVEPGLDQPRHQVVGLEVDADVRHVAGYGDARVREPVTLPGAGRREVDLEDPGAGVRVAVGEGVQARSEHDDLTRAALDGGGQGVLGEAVPGRDEDPQPRTVGRRRIGERLLAVDAQDLSGQRVPEDPAAVEVLVHRAVDRGAEGGPARLSLTHW